MAPKSEVSSPYTQEPATSPYPHPNESQPIFLYFILIKFSYLRLGLFHQSLVTFLSSPISATCPTHLILLDFICLMIFGDEYKI
jgi:hypothetical protein